MYKRPPLTCTSCRGTGYLHIGESIRGGPSRLVIDKSEPCWTCGGRKIIEDDGSLNAMGKSMYDTILKDYAGDNHAD